MLFYSSVKKRVTYSLFFDSLSLEIMFLFIFRHSLMLSAEPASVQFSLLGVANWSRRQQSEETKALIPKM